MAVTAQAWSHSVRILLVHPQQGCTGVLLLQTGKPTIHVDPTLEEVEQVRAELAQRRAARIPSDMLSYRSGWFARARS